MKKYQTRTLREDGFASLATA